MYERADISTVGAPRVQLVVVRDDEPRVQRLHQRLVELQTIRCPDVSAALAGAVEEVSEDLICDEQPEKGARTRVRQRAKEGRSVDVGSLALDRL